MKHVVKLLALLSTVNASPFPQAVTDIIAPKDPSPTECVKGIEGKLGLVVVALKGVDKRNNKDEPVSEIGDGQPQAPSSPSSDHPPTAPPSPGPSYPVYPPGSYPPVFPSPVPSYPTYPPGSYQPIVPSPAPSYPAYPPGNYPPGSYPSGSYPPVVPPQVPGKPSYPVYPPGSYPPVAPSPRPDYPVYPPGIYPPEVPPSGPSYPGYIPSSYPPLPSAPEPTYPVGTTTITVTCEHPTKKCSAEYPIVTGPLATQIGDGQPEAPVPHILTMTNTVYHTVPEGSEGTYFPVTQIEDGQPQAPGDKWSTTEMAAQSTYYLSATHPAGATVSQIDDGQIQAPSSSAHKMLARNAVDDNMSLNTTSIACNSGTLMMTLKDGILQDRHGRTGYIASNFQFQFDGPPQHGALTTAGYSLCPDGNLALGSSKKFYRCKSGNFYNLYDRDWASHCEPVHFQIIRLPENC